MPLDFPTWIGCTTAAKDLLSAEPPCRLEPDLYGSNPQYGVGSDLSPFLKVVVHGRFMHKYKLRVFPDTQYLVRHNF